MSYPLDEPDTGGGGDRFSAQDAANRRLVVVPVEYVPKLRTARGDEVDAIRVNVVDLQGTNGPQVYNGALWFGNRLIGAFRRKIGSILVGYVTKEKVSGGFEAWQFISLTQDPQTVTFAQSWLQQHPEFMENCKQDIQFSQGISNKDLGDPWADAQRSQSSGLPPLQPVPGLAQTPPAPIPAAVPATPPGPPPLPPIGAQQSAPPAPANPGMSVMDRLKAQAEKESGTTPEELQQYPF